MKDRQVQKLRMATQGKTAAVPLLQSSPTGTASSVQTLGNIIVSIVGTGVLGLPFAFRIGGWLAGSLGVTIAGLSTFYCMLLLVQCRDRLASEESADIQTYGDLGHKALGTSGRYATEFLVFVSQCGGSVAYLVFIGKNLSSIFRTHALSSSRFIFMLVPIEIALSWIRSLSALAPFSIFADLCNLLAMGIVLKEDLLLFEGFSAKTKAITTFANLPFAAGVAVFCFEGFGMTLALEASMRERRRFRWVLALAFTGITLVYLLFGFFGYLAYGDQTRDIVTLNLPNNWSTTAVKMGLCVGLALTFPIMMHPIHEILEGKLTESRWFQKLCRNDMQERFWMYLCRALLVVLSAALASFVPGFGVFVSFVGSTVCALLSFVLPAMFHLILMGSSLRFWQRALDFCILACGLAFAAHGTYRAAVGLSPGSS